MLLNIFEEQELKLHDDEVDGVDLLNNDDYTGYFRIVDYVEEGSLPRDELNKVYLEHRNQMQQQNPQPTLMLRWWKVFANDPKHMSQVDQTWIRDNYPKSFEALKKQITRESVEWISSVKIASTTPTPNSTLVSLRVPKFPETMTESTLTRFVEELRVYRLNGVPGTVTCCRKWTSPSSVDTARVNKLHSFIPR